MDAKSEERQPRCLPGLPPGCRSCPPPRDFPSPLIVALHLASNLPRSGTRTHSHPPPLSFLSLFSNAMLCDGYCLYFLPKMLPHISPLHFQGQALWIPSNWISLFPQTLLAGVPGGFANRPKHGSVSKVAVASYCYPANFRFFREPSRSSAIWS